MDTVSGAPLLLLAGRSGLLLVVNPLSGALETCFEGHGLAINDIAVHPSRPQFVATASRDQSLRLWNLRTRRVGRRRAGTRTAAACCPALLQVARRCGGGPAEGEQAALDACH